VHAKITLDLGTPVSAKVRGSKVLENVYMHNYLILAVEFRKSDL
jgi:hypothetical protein